MADVKIKFTPAKKVDPFVSLHSHSHYSVLDGYSTVPEYIKAAAELGQPAIAITDHGSLGSVYDLQKYSDQVGNVVKGIAGIEFYVVPSIGTIDSKEPLYLGKYENGALPTRDDVSGRGAYTHLTAIAENTTGLKNLFRLNEIANIRGYYMKPRVSLELLEEYKEGLIVTTGCPSGEVQTRIRLGDYEGALAYAARLVDIFGRDSVFIELMDHGMQQDLERKVKPSLLQIAETLKIGLVATTDSHYATKGDAKTHEEMLAIQTRAVMSEPADYDGGKRFAFEGGAYYLRSAAEMQEAFKDHPSAVTNTLVIAERSGFRLEHNSDLIPSWPIPEGHTEETYLREQARKGLAERLPDKANDPVYLERIEHELRVLVPKNFVSYFFIVADFMQWARFRAQPPVPTGYGRGSGAGSLIAFCLYITDPDPIKFDLLFERFVHDKRDNFPDFDTDFGPTDRARVINYVRQKYGEEYVSGIATFGGIKAKNAIKDIARIYEQPFEVGNKLTQALPAAIFGREMSLHDVYDPESDRYDEAFEFRQLVEREGYDQIVDSARKLEGRIRSVGQHAAAILISKERISSVVPMRRAKEDLYTTEFDFPTSEALGLLKVDFLGLRNLEIIRDCLLSIERQGKPAVNIQEILQGDLADPGVYRLLRDADTQGIFQMDGEGLRNLLKIMQPTSFNDISAVLALYRPGPMGMGSHTAYANRKNGREEVDYVHPEFAESLKPILGDTYGLFLYQEEVMQAAQVVGGYTLAEADNLRRAMGKKDRAKLDKEFVRFEAGALAQGYSPEAIQAVWDVLVPFADYGFNKSHSVAYGMISYVTAFLKVHYPSEYMAALLASVSDNTDKTAEYLEDCRQHGIKVMVPDINKSLTDYAPVDDHTIAFGFRAIKGVGEGVSDALVVHRAEHGAFTSFNNFLNTAPKAAVNKKVIQAMALGGAFDKLPASDLPGGEKPLSRRAIFEGAPDVLTAMSKARTKANAAVKRAEKAAEKARLQGLELPLDFGEQQEPAQEVQHNLPNYDEWSKLEMLKNERTSLGLYISGHPLEDLNFEGLASHRIGDMLYRIEEIDVPGAEEPQVIKHQPAIAPIEGWPGRDAKQQRIAGIVTSYSVRKTRKGDTMGSGVIEDRTGAMQFVLFPKVYSGDPLRNKPGYGRLMQLDGVVQLSGFSTARDDGTVNFQVEAVRPLEFSNSGSLSVRLKLTKSQWDRGQDLLNSIFRRYPATEGKKTNVIVSIKDEANGDKISEQTLNVSVAPTPALTSELRNAFGILAIGRWRTAS